MQTTTPPTASRNGTFTNIRLTILGKESHKGMASVLIGNAVFLTGIRIVQGRQALFVAMPSRRNSAGEFMDVAFPCNKEVRDELQDYILDEYDRMIRGGSNAD